MPVSPVMHPFVMIGQTIKNISLGELGVAGNKSLWLNGTAGSVFLPVNQDDYTNTITGWSGGTIVLNTSDFVAGSESVSITAVGTFNLSFTFPAPIDISSFGTFNISGKRTVKNSTLNSIRLETDATNYLEVLPATIYNSNWREDSFDISSFTVVGSPDLTNITKVVFNQSFTTPTTTILLDKMYFSGGFGVKWNTATNRFEFNNNLYANGSIMIDDNNFIYLDTAKTRGLKWDTVNNRIAFTNDVYAPFYYGDGSNLTGIPTAPVTSVFGRTGVVVIDGDVPLDFNDDGTAKTLTYNTVSGKFDLNDTLTVVGAVEPSGGVTLSNDVPISWGLTNTLFYSSLNSRFQFNAPLFSTGFVGDGSLLTNLPNQSPLTTKGDLFSYNTVDARLPVGTNGFHLEADSTEATGLKWVDPNPQKTVVFKEFWPYNLAGEAGSYNGNSYSASGTTVLGDLEYFKQLRNTVGGANVGDAYVFNTVVPSWRVAGTDITIKIRYATSNVDAGNIVMGLGWVATGLGGGEAYGGTITFDEQTFAIPNTGTTFEANEKTFTIAGASISNGDTLSCVNYRNGETGTDTYGGIIYVKAVEVFAEKLSGDD